jgi:hypothetical protein
MARLAQLKGHSFFLRSLLVIAAAPVVGIVGWILVVSFWPYVSAEGDGKDCRGQRPAGVATVRPARWRLARPAPTTKIVVALDDWANRPRRDAKAVLVFPSLTNTTRPALPQAVRVRAFLLGRLSSSNHTLQFQPTVSTQRTLDGRAILVEVCAKQPSSRDNPPGRFKGTIRVAGKRVSSVDLPVEVTIRAKRQNILIAAVLISLLGALLARYNAKDADVTEPERKEAKKTHFVLDWLPFLSGVAAGLAAAFTLYADDPTWGEHLGSDFAKLLTVTFAAATAGLTVTAPPARAAREHVAQASTSRTSSEAARERS